MKISLIITSCNRQRELDRFAFALSRQTFAGEVEVIFVAQGSAQFQLTAAGATRIRIIEERVEGPISLAKARNIGIKKASGEIVGFPDDDCWYEPDLLAKIAAHCGNHPNVDCICTDVYDPENKRSLGAPRPRGVTKWISYWNVFRLGNSNGIFVRAEALKLIGETFDEKLGVGTEIGSGEEVEFLGRLLDIGCKIQYAGQLSVYHEVSDNRTLGIDKIYNYAVGYAHVNTSFLKRGHIEVSVHFIEVVARSCAGVALFFLVQEKRALWWARLRGIAKGCVASAVEGEPSKKEVAEISAGS
jgi:GT2 family glycosyltransferase